MSLEISQEYLWQEIDKDDRAMHNKNALQTLRDFELSKFLNFNSNLINSKHLKILFLIESENNLCRSHIYIIILYLSRFGDFNFVICLWLS